MPSPATLESLGLDIDLLPAAGHRRIDPPPTLAVPWTAKESERTACPTRQNGPELPARRMAKLWCSSRREPPIQLQSRYSMTCPFVLPRLSLGTQTRSG